ncbi:hypothetical protein Athai_01140 [Actinocatenispora thailandica]|uniref:ACT domain-containing protein n=1 Tax=Actinocatenispora thailandica TaxID=227318 RepID=A0A7R7DJG9_9ACTN|nr:ACT domain-containing protein [Actinocatenispora thailandica]BCJ32611.1 hypothetical protein Athai_01140 [Actinocatenispora thailandica]
MLTRLRVRMPDRPGTLGRIAAALGAADVDIRQVRALDVGSGRAVVDVLVALPATMLPGAAARMLTGIPGVRLDGCWQTSDSLELELGLEALAETLATPQRALPVLVEATPRVVAAHWSIALAVPSGRAVRASWRAPRLAPSPLTDVRPHTSTAADGTRLAVVPLGQDHALLTGRRNAPPFHQSELRSLTTLARAAARLIDLTGATRPARPSLSLVGTDDR